MKYSPWRRNSFVFCRMNNSTATVFYPKTYDLSIYTRVFRSDSWSECQVREPRAFPRLRRSDRVPQSSCYLGVRAWILEFYGAFVSMAHVRFRSARGLLRTRIKLIRRSHKLEHQDHEKSRSDTTLRGWRSSLVHVFNIVFPVSYTHLTLPTICSV